ncbi:MAG: hypothetical protein IJA14_00710, partial [Alphaproteobacteria bacterium]|nr:hypothetical protein [Alphaproteobacteria bacterium]
TFNENVWKTRIEFKDLNGEICTIDVDNEKLSDVGDPAKELIHKGFCPDISSKNFKKYLLKSFRNREKSSDILKSIKLAG